MPDNAGQRVAAAARSPLASAIGIVAVVAVITLVAPSGKTVSLLSFVAILSMVAYSIAIPFRYAGILMIAQGAVWACGAYTAALLVTGLGWSTWLVLPVVATVGAVAGVLVGLLALRSRGHYFLIVAFAINELVVFIASQTEALGGVSGLLLVSRPSDLFGLSFASPLSRLWLYVAFAVLAMVVFLLVGRTPFGRRLIALRENEPLARATGVPALQTRLTVLALAGAVAGIAGMFYAYHQRAVVPSLFSAVTFLQVVLMVIIGGTRSGMGPFLGALLLLSLPDLLDFSPLARQLLYGGILILAILLIPEGPVAAVRSRLRRRTRPPGSETEAGDPAAVAAGASR